MANASSMGGDVVYHFWIAPVERAPSPISKLNTAMEFLLLLAVLAIQAGYVPDGLWRQILLLVTLATIAWSGGHVGPEGGTGIAQSGVGAEQRLAAAAGVRHVSPWKGVTGHLCVATPSLPRPPAARPRPRRSRFPTRHRSAARS